MNTEVTSRNLKLRLLDKNHESGLWKYVSGRIIRPELGSQTNNMTWTSQTNNMIWTSWTNNMTWTRLPDE
ncbi:hypothetical protein RclHR1_08930008 [Rhizophagus clarus]|uniref:Uncharacterized protein n=1 Tax=Rhizophagus clarus TaxID=94130 RepID=A0A2Z6SDA2_9GLOM|nr:hypothetical protein RclHR1_08930008 [Rhizophagus clarus]